MPKFVKCENLSIIIIISYHLNQKTHQKPLDEFELTFTEEELLESTFSLAFFLLLCTIMHFVATYEERRVEDLRM